MKRKPTRLGEPAPYANLRGEPIDLAALQRSLLGRPEAGAEALHKPPANPAAKAPRLAHMT